MAILRRYGHRGACGHAPENTLASVRKALELNVSGFEFDIQLSKNGEPVVIHDDTLERTTNGKGLVADYSFKELQQFDAGQGEKIPHLNEVFALADKRCDLIIELKANAAEAVEACINTWISKGWHYDRIWVVSFNHQQLTQIRRLNPSIQTGALFECIPVRLAALATDAGAEAICPYVGCMNKALVDDAHKLGLKVITWTANTPRDIAYAKSLGVDGIMSDFPERL